MVSSSPLNFNFLSGSEYTGGTLFQAPDYYYYKTINVGSGGNSQVDTIYNIPNGNEIGGGGIYSSDFIFGDNGSALEFCTSNGYLLSGYTTNSSSSSYLRQFNGSSRNSVSSTGNNQLNTLTCYSEVSNLEVINVVNNKQLFEQLFEIKTILIYFFIFFLFFGFYNILSKYALSYKMRK